MHSRRARPTLRLLREDLTSGWESPYAPRALADGDLAALHPLSELPHPIVAKAAESFPHDDGGDKFVGLIASSTRIRLLEIKVGQWRGAVWQEPDTGVNWLVAAGLAKGEHRDHDDFYVQVKQADAAAATDQWMPTDADKGLLRQETLTRLLTEWELGLQASILEALRAVQHGGEISGAIAHPYPGKGQVAEFTLSVTDVRETDYHADEIELSLVPDPKYAGGDLLWQATIRALITLSPPEQGWDRYQDTFFNIAEPGTFATRVQEVERLMVAGELAQSVPGEFSHYTHRQHLAGNTIDGKAVRALCGVFFVPAQDHETLPVCPRCEHRYADLPK